MTNVARRLRWAGATAAAVLTVAPALLGSSAAPVHPPLAHPPILGVTVGITSLNPMQLAGQRVIYSYTGLTPPASLIQRIEAGQAAGVIFFGDNISSETQISSVITQLRAADAKSPVKAPLLLMTDQEGGQVRRLPGAPAMSEKEIGAAADPVTAAGQAGTGAGQNLAGVGMNVNLAPVLDVFRQAGDFDDQFQRSYSMNPATAASAGSAFVKAQQQVGPAATVKHFPGLGSATAAENTDAGPVTLDVSLSELRSDDELPYPAAISAGVKLVMLSWATYPALDASHPAGLSPAVVGELRGRLGFKGVTITDALEAGALKAFGTDKQRGVAAAAAGMDLLLCSGGTVAQGDDVETALAAAFQSGQLSPAAFEASVNRITALRNGLH
ncbi:MAG TPA: glycoside hydrolase family 3 N-terminal domain-containing protein [Pseudonocardiaceae bacterium]